MGWSILHSNVPDTNSSCYVTTSSGAKIQLNQICKDYKPMENKNVTVQILPNGNTETTIVGNEPYTLPDGSVIQLVGQIMRTTWPNGVRSELIPGAKGSGFQYYSPDGNKLLPRQTIQLPDGRVIEQELL